MADANNSGLRHRAVTQDSNVDAIATGIEVMQESSAGLPVPAFEGTVDFSAIPDCAFTNPDNSTNADTSNTSEGSSTLVSRDYVVCSNPFSRNSIYNWTPPAPPHWDSIEFADGKKPGEPADEKPAEPMSVGSILAEALVPLNALNTIAYLALLASNAKSTGLSIPVTLFAIGQVSDGMGTILESVWKTIINLVRDRTPRREIVMSKEIKNVPGVDVLVVCCGEPDDIIVDTVKAACDIDWPANKMRVIVCDDGRSASLEEMIEELQATHGNLHYFSRDKPVHGNHGNKAGNLNATLETYIAKLPAGHNETFAVFDADMMPEKNALTTLMPYLIADEKVGMVTAAQFHYNVPNDDPLNQGNTTGTGADDSVRDSANAAWCPGSGWVMRLQAWSDIKKFPEFSITEDLITSWFLHGCGWKIILIPGVMQWGLQPDCILTHLKQRRRWWTGHIRDALRFNFTLNDDRLSGAHLIQRYAMFQHACRPYTMTITRAISTLMIFLCLVTGGPLVAVSDVGALKQILICVAISRAILLVDDIKSISGGYYLKMRVQAATGVWMGHHFSRDTLLSLLPRRLGGLRLGFGVSGVDDQCQVAVKERDITKRPRLFTRLWTIHKREGILWHLVLFVLTISIIGYRVWAQIKASTVDGKFILNNDFWLSVVKSVGFPALGLIENVPYYLTPIVYVMFPPTTPPRRELMVYDAPSGLWKPSPEHTKVKYTMAS